MDSEKQVTFALIIANRGFFPGHLCEAARTQLLDLLEGSGYQVITLSPEQTSYGSVESLADARKCADLLAAHRSEIDGIIVSLPNFGDERAVANSIRWSGLDVPVLVQAYPDDQEKLAITDRRDAFCGKISVCNNLHQYGIPYSLTDLHTVEPDSPAFRQDLERFAGICRVFQALKNLRVGVVGARPAAFNTVRYSEKLLEREGISVEPIDLSEMIHRAENIADDDPDHQAKLQAINSYLPAEETPQPSLVRMAKLGVALDRWVEAQQLSAVAIQCWTALEEIYGVVPCTLMSMLSNSFLPSACETDIMGVISMFALATAASQPSAIVDFNNNFGQDPDKCVVFHCSNLPKDLLVQEDGKNAPGSTALISYHDILSGALGKERSWGIIAGIFQPGPYSFCRISSDDFSGSLTAYLGEGAITDDRPLTFGGYGVMKIDKLQTLLRHICENGLEHHVSLVPGNVAPILEEVFSKYRGWKVYHHPAHI
jgi:L-fucose isomerase-like protein